MKIAIPVQADGNIDNHFGHCEFYNVYTVTNGQIEEVQQIKSEQGCGCKSNIASTLSEQGVKVMLAGGIGNGAINVLANSGIEVVRGCEGHADELIQSYVKGELKDGGKGCKELGLHLDHDHQCSH